MSLKRFAAVTVGLAAAGFVVGAGLCGAIAAVVLASAEGMRGFARHGEYVLFAALWGGGVGAVLGPAAAWLLMRHVPLWKAIAGTALGTLAGVAMGILLSMIPGQGQLLMDVQLFGSPILGFGVAALVLRRSAARQASARIAASDGGRAPSLPLGSG